MKVTTSAAALALCCFYLAWRGASRKRKPAHRRIFIARHGKKQDNTPQADNFGLELLPEAYEPLAVLRAFLDTHNGVEFSTVLSSPFLRCRQTASALSSCDIGLEPGLSESLNVKCGLRDGSGVAGPLALLVAKMNVVLSERCPQRTEHKPLVTTQELEKDEPEKANPQSMVRAAKLVARLQTLHGRDDGAFPMLLVTHGCPSFGLVRAFVDGTTTPPVYDSSKIPEMGSVTVLEQGAGGPSDWRVVGSLCPRLAHDGVWECCWRAQAAGGADASKL
jgi:broad specificity phosphatase PhoE